MKTYFKVSFVVAQIRMNNEGASEEWMSRSISISTELVSEELQKWLVFFGAKQYVFCRNSCNNTYIKLPAATGW